METPYNPDGRNNLSRRMFKQFLEDMGLTRVDARNVYMNGDEKWVYALETPDQTIRQFYDDCAGAYVVGVGHFTRDQLSVQQSTRRRPTGNIARNASYKRRDTSWT